MKKVIISSAVALALSFTAMASSAFASYTFSNYLTVGSTGADVTALQSWLVSSGFLTMPAGVSMGYFGSLTKAAVVAYQASVGLPNTGFVGPLTVAKLNAAEGMTMNTSCPVGYTCTPPASTTTFSCPVGWSCTPAAGTVTTTSPVANLTAITTPGVAGTLNIAKGTFTGNGITVNDGQSVDVASFDLQAGASDMQVSSVDFDFNVRPWLYVNSFSVYNAATGATLATVSGLTSANFTELVVGSEYRLTIPGVSLVVPAGKKITIVLHAQFATSNRTATNIYVTRAEVRAVDGTGVTTTQSIGDGISTSSGLNLYVAYGGQNNSNLIITIDPSSPNQGIVQTNTGTTQTQNVLLGVYDIKSQNINATLQSLNVNLNMSGIGSIGTDFANVQLKTGSTLLTSGSIASPAASTSVVSFTNFNLPLPMNTYVPVSVYVTVNGGVNGIQASTSLTVLTANVGGIDANSNPLTVSGSGTLPSSNQSFILSGVNLSNLAWAIATPGSSNNGTLKTTTFSGSFTVTAGSNPIYISTSPAIALATSTNATTTTGVVAAVTNFVPSNGLQSYDVAGTDYQITPGSSRTFTINGTVANGAGVSQSIAVGISKITFGSTPTGTDLPISFLLQGLNSDFHIQVLAGTN
jgi:hypothetical protein